MTPAFEQVHQLLKQLPGLGYRSAERIALHLLIERPERLTPILDSLKEASEKLQRCKVTGNITEGDVCEIYADPNRDKSMVCVVEYVPDLIAMERAGVYRGTYHVLHGKLSPVQGIGPEHLNFESLSQRVEKGEVKELILALSNDIEAEATCHYIQEVILKGSDVKVSRIGFGLPSGAAITYADAATLKSAFDGRKNYA